MVDEDAVLTPRLYLLLLQMFDILYIIRFSVLAQFASPICVVIPFSWSKLTERLRTRRFMHFENG